MELTRILPKKAWAGFERELSEKFDINCTVYDSSGTGITGKPNWCNKLCPRIKGNPESLAVICASGNQNFMAQARQTRKSVVAECDAGFIKIAVPIVNNGDFLGTAGGCGLLPEGGELETFIIEKTTGLDREEILALCEGVKTMSAGKAAEMVGFIEKRIARYMDDYHQKRRKDISQLAGMEAPG